MNKRPYYMVEYLPHDGYTYLNAGTLQVARPILYFADTLVDRDRLIQQGKNLGHKVEHWEM